MGLRAEAAKDLKSIIENPEEFGWPLAITDPQGVVIDVVGLSNDIGFIIDPETGLPVKGRSASASVCLSTLEATGLGIPQGMNHPAQAPWLVTTEDINGNEFTFKVSSTQPDRTIDIIVLFLEAWDD